MASLILEKVNNEKKETQIDYKDNVWYFAYGSNMSSETFQSHRGIKPLEAVPVRIPGWTLTFDIYGIPYREPAFSSISRISQETIRWRDGIGQQISWTTPSPPVVHGTAYLVSREAYISIVGSEGGGSAYEEVEVLAESVEDSGNYDYHEGSTGRNSVSRTEKGGAFRVMTLTRAYGPTLPRLPSKRYKDIITRGAVEANLPLAYQAYLSAMPHYDPPKSGLRLIGAYLFSALWVPLMSVAERLTQATVNFDGQGNCPAWVQQIVRLILMIMWFHHDFIHSMIWGRGDGLDSDSEVDVMEKGGLIQI